MGEPRLIYSVAPVAAQATEVAPPTEPEAPAPEPMHSRRNVLAAGLAGLAGLVVGSLGRPIAAQASAGSPLVMGAANSAGAADTSLTTASTGTALLVTQTGAGTAIRGSATAVNGIAGFFTSANGPGVSGVTANEDKFAVYAGQNAGTTGAGAALRASGGQNSALVATTATVNAPTIKAVNSAVATSYTADPAILGLASAGTQDDIDGLAFGRAAGEFCGPNGVIAVASPEVAGGCGVVAFTSATSGVGHLGYALSATGPSFGALGVCHADAGVGAAGHATNAGGYTIGVSGVADSTAGTGVSGYATATSGYTTGVEGEADSTSGVGVFGYAPAGTGTTYGVFGQVASASGYALYGAGRGAVTGNFSKAGGSFKIDHPLDPANKYLLHSFVESSDMMNVYNGIATLDAAGEATVTLPDWFEALNRDFRYQLTSIGEFSPVFVKSKVDGGSFTIGGGKPGQEISWQLTGIRQDAWANAHRIEVEEAKTADEKGLYLHPIEHGESASMGLRQHAPKAAPSVPAHVRSFVKSGPDQK